MELCRPKSVDNYFTCILQSSVGTLEGHSEVGVYLASFCVPNWETGSLGIYLHLISTLARTQPHGSVSRTFSMVQVKTSPLQFT